MNICLLKIGRTLANVNKLKNKILSERNSPVQDLVVSLLDLFQVCTEVNIYTNTLSSLLYKDKNYIRKVFCQRWDARKTIDSLLELEYRIYTLTEHSLDGNEVFARISKDQLEKFKSSAITLIRYYLLEQDYAFYMSSLEFSIVQSFAYAVFEDRRSKNLPLAAEEGHHTGITGQITTYVGRNLKGICFSEETLLNMENVVNPLIASPHRASLIYIQIPQYKEALKDTEFLGQRIGILAHPLLEAFAVELMRERDTNAFAEIYGEHYYTPIKGQKRRYFVIDLDIIMSDRLRKDLEAKGYNVEGWNEVALDFTIPSEKRNKKGQYYFEEKFDKGYQTIRQLMKGKRIKRPLFIIAYGPNSEAGSELVNNYKDLAETQRMLGQDIEVLSFDEYCQKFLDLENPNTNDVHIKRLKALNDLVINAYTDPDAYERLYNLYRYYKNKLDQMGCGKKEYEAYYGL